MACVHPDIGTQEGGFDDICCASLQVDYGWGVVFVKGIGANWLVCLALWLGISAESLEGKIIGLWVPVMAFVAIG